MHDHTTNPRRRTDEELAEMRANAKHWRDRALNTQGTDPESSREAWRTPEDTPPPIFESDDNGMRGATEPDNEE